MYIVKILFAVVLSIFPTSTKNLDGDIPIIEIKDEHSVENGQRSLSIPFSCSVESSSSIIITSFLDSLNSTISVYNESTGEVYNCEVELSTIPYRIGLFSSGYYTLTIRLSSGRLFYGSFQICD